MPGVVGPGLASLLMFVATAGCSGDLWEGWPGCSKLPPGESSLARSKRKNRGHCLDKVQKTLQLLG